MVTTTRVISAVLVLVGVGAYIATGRESATALAPAVVGVLLGLLGAAARGRRTKAVIHSAMVVSLLGVLASVMPLRDSPALLAGDAERPGAVVAAGAMALLCAAHLFLGVRSFVAARRGRNDVS